MTKHMYIQINLRQKEPSEVDVIEEYGGTDKLVQTQAVVVGKMLAEHGVYDEFDVVVTADLIDESQGGHE